MHWDILDKERLEVLPKLSFLKEEGFYLAGGTALALHFGHRDSIDFDFFTDKEFQTSKLFEKLVDVFGVENIKKSREEDGTLVLAINSDIRLSFFKFQYKLLKPVLQTEHLSLASIIDIACMKLSAICSRSTIKDYVDLYIILKTISLNEIILALEEKMPTIDTELVLKSLVYFDDIVEEKIIFKERVISLDEIKKFFISEVEKVRVL